MSDDLHHLAAAYALDALTPDERRSFESHYPSCDICTNEVDEYRATTAHLAAATAEEPPPELRTRVLAEIADTRQLSAITEADHHRARPRVPTWGYALAAAATLLVIVAGGAIFATRDSTGGLDDEVAAILAEPDAQLVALAGEGQGSLSVVWSQTRAQVAVVGDGVATVDGSDTYELWRLDDTGATPAGLFVPDGDGRVLAVNDLDGDPTGWGVTVEPESGSPQPTGDILYLAEV